MKEQHRIILDQSGRHVVGKLVEETDTTITLHNPVFLFIEINPQTNAISVNTYPVLIFEFIDKDNRDKNNWTYSKSSVVVSDVVLDDKFLSQYQRVNTPPVQAQPQAAPSNSPKIVSIDDL